MTTDTQHGVARKSKRIRLEDGEKVFVGADYIERRMPLPCGAIPAD